jgi:hypothetical protein
MNSSPGSFRGIFMKIFFFSTFLILTLISCAGSPFNISRMSPDELQNQDILPLCRAYSHEWHKGNENIRAELIRRNVFTTDEMQMIDQGQIGIGMSQMAVICSWGYPYDVNKTVGSWGVRKQLVYRGTGTYSKSKYIYIENEKVTSWQD